MHLTFDQVIGAVLKHEGGFVNHPKDPGGATNKGVTIATFRKYVKPGGTVADLKRLTTAQAAHVYRRQYWDRISGDRLPAGIDYATFDFAVNSGPNRAAKYLQRVLGVAQDGVIGPKTIDAANNSNPIETVNRLCDDRLAFMKRIRGGRLWKTFGKGWSRRVGDVRELATDLALVPVPKKTQPKPIEKAPQRPQEAQPKSATPETPRGGVAALIGLLFAALTGWAIGAWETVSTFFSNLFGG